MGRRKIQIQPIKDDRNRQVTFLKRKQGLMKKAYELSVLCDCEVALFIIPSNDKMIQYSSSDMNQLIHRFQQNDLPREIKTNKDFASDIKAEEDVDNEEKSLKQGHRAMIQDQANLNHNSMVSPQPSVPYTSYTMNQHHMAQMHAQPMYLFQQHQPTASKLYYHSPNTLSPVQSPKSEPSTPGKKQKMAISTMPTTLSLPSQFPQTPSPSAYYPAMYPSHYMTNREHPQLTTSTSLSKRKR